ncbi:MAG: STAS domain-containing protein [Frankiaceae bacterium]|nr:STAS domain-containing protein [Frankiaceae bacterium]MBV9368373.1 STAS domain-containing protein [Frankiales bacterium]
MTTATAELVEGRVASTHLADGMVVQLGGMLTDDNLPELRGALLSPFVSSCRDVVVDAGEVVDVTEPALAVLVAARDWAEHNGRRFFISGMSPLLRAALEVCEVTLPELGARPGLTTATTTTIPGPRKAAD